MVAGTDTDYNYIHTVKVFQTEEAANKYVDAHDYRTAWGVEEINIEEYGVDGT